jgi:hypothetical protein
MGLGTAPSVGRGPMVRPLPLRRFLRPAGGACPPEPILPLRGGQLERRVKRTAFERKLRVVEARRPTLRRDGDLRRRLGQRSRLPGRRMSAHTRPRPCRPSSRPSRPSSGMAVVTSHKLAVPARSSSRSGSDPYRGNAEREPLGPVPEVVPWLPKRERQTIRLGAALSATPRRFDRRGLLGQHPPQFYPTGATSPRRPGPSESGEVKRAPRPAHPTPAVATRCAAPESSWTTRCAAPESWSWPSLPPSFVWTGTHSPRAQTGAPVERCRIRCPIDAPENRSLVPTTRKPAVSSGFVSSGFRGTATGIRTRVSGPA